MRRIIQVFTVFSLVLVLGLSGCGPQKAGSSKEAIDISQSLQTVQERANYLIGQAKAFYSSKDFQSSVDIAQYVLTYLDKDSQEAKDLLQKAKQQIQAIAQGAVDDARGALGGLGK